MTQDSLRPEGCPFCGGIGPYTEASNHKVNCHHGDLIDEYDRVREALQLVLPMAKAYAQAHKVGSNQKYIECAEAVLEDNMEDAQ